MSDVQKALSDADHQSTRAYHSTDVHETAEWQGDALYILLRQLLVEVSALRQDVAALRAASDAA